MSVTLASETEDPEVKGHVTSDPSSTSRMERGEWFWLATQPA